MFCAELVTINSIKIAANDRSSAAYTFAGVVLYLPSGGASTIQITGASLPRKATTFSQAFCSYYRTCN
jgi:hypothetical protein